MANTYTTRPTNGVTFGYKHTVTTSDANDDTVIIDFQVDYALSASVEVKTSAGAKQVETGLVVTYPADGQVSIAEGGSFTFSAGDIIDIVATRDSQSLTL